MRKGGEQLQPIQPILLSTPSRRSRNLVKNHGRIEGVPTGYAELDDLLTGLHARRNWVLIAARPSMGKTSFGMNIVENAAIRAGKKTAGVLPGNARRAAGHAHALHRGQGGHAARAPRADLG